MLKNLIFPQLKEDFHTLDDFRNSEQHVCLKKIMKIPVPLHQILKALKINLSTLNTALLLHVVQRKEGFRR
jgi:hypothetical protein